MLPDLFRIIDEIKNRLSVLERFSKQISLLDVYPVGSIYISVVSTNPGMLFGGTWVSFGAGKTLVGINAAETEFNTVEETGGAKTHTLLETEMPTHYHTARQPYKLNNGTTAGISGEQILAGVNGVYGSGATVYNAMPTFNTGNAGSSGAHNNLQPYIVTYMWKRTV